MFAKLGIVIISFIMSVCLNESTQIPQDGFL